MLCLSRQQEECILIGDDIKIKVLSIRGDKVRLGVSAPKSVSVHREEVAQAIRNENRKAAQVKPEDLPKPGDVICRCGGHMLRWDPKLVYPESTESPCWRCVKCGEKSNGEKSCAGEAGKEK